MTQYIDKSIVMTEIKRLLAFYLKEIENNKKDPWAMDIAKRDILQEILSFLDSLEVIEIGVDTGSPEGDWSSEAVQFINADGNIEVITFNKAQKGE